jgi:hypothetical protein
LWQIGDRSTDNTFSIDPDFARWLMQLLIAEIRSDQRVFLVCGDAHMHGCFHKHLPNGTGGGGVSLGDSRFVYELITAGVATNSWTPSSGTASVFNTYATTYGSVLWAVTPGNPNVPANTQWGRSSGVLSLRDYAADTVDHWLSTGDGTSDSLDWGSYVVSTADSGGSVELLTSLVSHWALDEVSNGSAAVQRSDSHSTHHLSDNNTVASNTGKVGQAADFVPANSEYLSGTVPWANESFTIAGWVWTDDVAAFRDAFGKWSVSDNNRECLLVYDNSVGKFRFYVSSDGANAVSVAADGMAAVETGRWYLVVVWHNAVGDTINIQINNSVVDTLSHAAGVFNSSALFTVGARTASSSFWDGRVDLLSVWDRLLTANERKELYNAGSALAYSEWESGEVFDHTASGGATVAGTGDASARYDVVASDGATGGTSQSLAL